jgi:cold shock CspA family protein
MRHQGRITSWKDDKGFGFITPNGGGAEVFLHISAIAGRRDRPTEGELVTYELMQDERGRPRARNVAYVSTADMRRVHSNSRRSGARVPLRLVFSIVLLAAFGWFAWTKVGGGLRARANASATPASVPAVEAPSEQFRCTGKVYCREMTSCAEAKFYLRHCPGVKIDGDGDGIPCEREHCGS